MSKIVRKNESNPLLKVGECLCRNGHGVYFASFSLRGKEVKRSLKTMDRELARRRLSLGKRCFQPVSQSRNNRG